MQKGLKRQVKRVNKTPWEWEGVMRTIRCSDYANDQNKRPKKKK